MPWAGCEHLTSREDQAWLERTGPALFPWSSQSRGFFARANRDDTSDAELVRCYGSEDNFQQLARTCQLAAELGVTHTAIAPAHVPAQPFPTFRLIGPRSVEETRASMAGLFVQLSHGQMRWLDLRDRGARAGSDQRASESPISGCRSTVAGSPVPTSTTVSRTFRGRGVPPSYVNVMA